MLSIDKKSGAKYLLSDDQKMIAAGFVFYENAKNREFHEKEYKEFIKNHFNVDISRVTANNYLHEAGFTSRAMTTKKGGFKYDAQTLIEMYWNWNWIYKIRRDGLFTTNGSKLCSIDFVFTSHLIEATEELHLLKKTLQLQNHLKTFQNTPIVF